MSSKTHRSTAFSRQARLASVFFLTVLALMPTAKANQITITNVTWRAGGAAGTSDLQFDLAWSNSWRAAWQLSENEHVGAGTLDLENWDAAWVFIKFRRPGDAAYSHATLSTHVADHRVPTNAALEVGLSRVGGGDFGAGVFIYRAAGEPWAGPAAYEGVRLRWLHEADGVPAADRVDLQVHAIEMVRVPGGAFKAGSGNEPHTLYTYPSSTVPYLIESEGAIAVGAETGNLYYAATANGDQAGPVPAAFPKGYRAFYCMKYEVTQGQYAAFLNTLTYGQQAARTAFSPASAAGTRAMTSSTTPVDIGRSEIRIVTPGVSPDTPAVYATSNAYVACNLLTWSDGAAYAAWAGLRPMTELEFEKACRGPRIPVQQEMAWGASITLIANAKYTYAEAGSASETIGTNYSLTAGNSVYSSTYPTNVPAHSGPARVGIFATGNSGRLESGASYWGVMEMSGNVREPTVTLGNAAGRSFTGLHGNGRLNVSGQATTDYWPGINGNSSATTASEPYGGVTGVAGAAGMMFRGGAYTQNSSLLRVSDRSAGYLTTDGRIKENGFRGVRTAP